MHTPQIDILYITFNRIDYTRKTLPAMIKNAGVEFKLTIFDNGSTDGTVEYLEHIQRKYQNAIAHVFYNKENIGISMPTNVFWKQSKADYVGKVDNDTLLPENWLKSLLEAHEKSKRLGVLGGFHFNKGYFSPGELEGRVVNIDGVDLIPDPHIGGCCYIMPRHIQQKMGFLNVNLAKKTYGWTEYQWDIFKMGYVNGYLYPSLYVEHFDDPLSEYNLLFTKHLDSSKVSLGDKNIVGGIESMKEWYAKDARRLINGSTFMRFQ